jgi:hypothetical protein
VCDVTGAKTGVFPTYFLFEIKETALLPQIERQSHTDQNAWGQRTAVGAAGHDRKRWGTYTTFGALAARRSNTAVSWRRTGRLGCFVKKGHLSGKYQKRAAGQVALLTLYISKIIRFETKKY